MRKQFLLTLILCLAASLTWAERIDVATARKVAESVAQREGATGGLRSAGELPLVYAAAPGQSGSALRSGAMEGAADYFVFNFPGGKGFAIVAGDDRVRPVLGYSNEGSFDPDNLPENLRGWLAGYQEQITWAVNKGIEATPEISAEWSQLMSGTALRAAGEPVLLKTANWGQGEPYNRQTPVIGRKHAMTGCVATAMGIIMKYHEYPQKAVNPPAINTYKILHEVTTSTITYNEYDWDNMLLAYDNSYNDTQVSAVSKLLWHCGANVEMDYMHGTSGAIQKKVAKVLPEVFGYSPAIRHLDKEAYRWNEWKKMITDELSEGFPIIYGGQDSNGKGGHSFVCDGYDLNGLFHINWGWNGMRNGYFMLSLLDDNDDGYGYNKEVDMVIHIRPQPNEEKYVVAPYLTEASYIFNNYYNRADVTFRFKYTGNENHTFFFGLGVVDQEGLVKQVPTSPISMPLTGFSDGYTIYPSYGYGYSSSIDLLSALQEGERVTLLCSPNGSDWEVMHGLDCVPLGADSNGQINSTPEGPRPTMSVDIMRNNFDSFILPISGLNNNQDHTQNVSEIYYSFSEIVEPEAIIRYTIRNYSEWKDKLAIYYDNDKYNLGTANAGTPIVINDNGVFYLNVNLGQYSETDVINYFKVLTNQVGELIYDIQIYAKSDQNTPIFERLENYMTFANIANGIFDKFPIRGAVNSDIPFAISYTNVDDFLVSRPLCLSIFIEGVGKDQIQLFDTDGNSIHLNGNESSAHNLNVSVGKIENNTSYSFKIKSNIVYEFAIRMFTYVGGKRLPSSEISTYVHIDPTEINTHTVTGNFLDLKFIDGTTNVIEEGKEFTGQLICEKEGYRLPASITVTMDGKTLAVGTDYTYDRTNGWINIPAVTGDIVITAAAEPIPAVTYTIKAGQMIGATSDIPSGGKSVQENSECTIKLTAEPGYLIKKTDIIIKTADKTLQQGEDYTYTEASDYKSGTVKIHAVTADMELFVYADPEPKSFSIIGKLTNLTANEDIVNGVFVKENESFSFILTPAKDYRLPEDITVTPSTIQYTYDKATGEVVINKVTENVTITAAAIDDHHFNVILKPGEGVVSTPEAIEQQFTVGDEAAFNVKFAAAEGYTYDGSITVVMGEKPLAIGTDYTYNKETGEFKLLKGIEAALIISTAKGVKKQYTITVTCTSLTPMEVPNTVAHGDPLSFKIAPDEGYNLPEAIEVKMGGNSIAATDYTYNKATGEVSIAKVTGNVEVTAVAVVKTYDVKLNLTQLASDFVPGTKVTHGEPLDITLTALTGYKLPQEVTVLMNGKPDTNFQYKDGKISIAKVLGPIEITAKANQLHPVTEKVEGVTIEGSENVAEGETFTATVKPSDGYHLPYAISVVMNGRQLSAGEYTYDRQTGEIEIKNVSGLITISAKGIQDGYFEVVLNLTNLTFEPTPFEPQAKNSKIELTLKPSSGYELPSGIAVEMRDVSLSAGTGYTYDRSTGKFTLEKITGTLVITATGSRIPEPEPEPEPEPTPTTYTVTLPVVEGATIAATGSTTVTEGSSLSFTVEVKAGYNADNMVVKANGSTLTPDANGRYTVANIRSNVVVTVTGIVKGDNPTANETIGSDELRVWAANGRLFIQTPVADTAYIVAFDGRVYKTLSLSAGEYSEQMPQGSYIIHIGKRSYKLNF